MEFRHFEMDFLTTIEKNCISHKLLFPELSRSILKKIKFNISREDLIDVSSKLKEGYGTIVNLNELSNLKLQYHGRFKSFLIGFGINPENPNQPDLKMLRFDNSVESTHNDGTMCFLGRNKIKGPHIHWYNSFYSVFLNQGIFNLREPNRMIYNKIIELFIENNKNLNLNANLLQKSVSYSIFLDLCKFIIKEKRKLREDGHITSNNKLKNDPVDMLKQILNKEFLK